MIARFDQGRQWELIGVQSNHMTSPRAAYLGAQTDQTRIVLVCPIVLDSISESLQTVHSADEDVDDQLLRHAVGAHDHDELSVQEGDLVFSELCFRSTPLSD